MSAVIARLEMELSAGEQWAIETVKVLYPFYDAAHVMGRLQGVLTCPTSQRRRLR
jgi:hypothetical protein